MKKLVIIVLAVSLFPLHLFAWGKKGHAIVAEIAFNFLDSNTKKTVLHYLGNTSIEDASIWMDEMRSNHDYDYMKPWHYINIDKGSVYKPTKDPNIVNALNMAEHRLERRKRLNDSEIKANIMIIMHLTGDMHMPLHVGYGSDKGGNDVHVMFFSTPSNLHKVWDTDIIEHEGISLNDCMALYNQYDPQDIQKLREVNIENWITEPRALLDYVYNFDNNTIDQDYVNRSKPIIEQQLFIAGVRLAALLQQAFN